ncbi:MAG: gluconate permease [Gammaproteobacteria bacterium]|nr:gluconate permease [Gammaproteobacteria bacterium]
MASLYPFLILAVGLAVVVGGILVLRLHAFIALIAAAFAVSLLAPGEWADKIPRVAEGFGATATGVGIVISLAAIIGMAMTASGAADRVVAMFLRLFGERHADASLMASGFVLAIPVFFDTVFFLLVPLVRSMFRRTGHGYVRCLVAAAICAVTHALVPPTPGPLVVADALGVGIGTMMLAGLLASIPAALAGLVFASWADKHVHVTSPTEAVTSSFNAGQPLPALGWSLAPVLLPLLLIALAAVTGLVTTPDNILREITAVLGHPQFALLLGAVVALYVYWRQRRPSVAQMGEQLNQALMAAGVIVLITCAGGAFGSALRSAGLAPAVQALAGESSATGMGILLLGFSVAAVLKFAQGSSTAAMIVTSAMIAAMIEPGTLGFHPVYAALAIGSGSLVGSWMNDSGFWLFARMGGLTEAQTLKTWTPLLALLGCTAMLMTLLMAVLMPMA